MHVRKFNGPVAKLRWLWWRWVRRYRYEVCFACGRPVSRATPTWWHAPDALWLRVEWSGAIRCVPCFTRDCRELGITVSWAPVIEYDRDLLTGRRDDPEWTPYHEFRKATDPPPWGEGRDWVE